MMVSTNHFRARNRRARRLTIAILAIGLTALIAPPARAVVIDVTNAGLINTSAPANDPGWANVGQRGAGPGTGIYVGNQWVLTAAHVGAGSITLNGQSYAADSGTPSVRLKNPDNSVTDLLLYRLASNPGLPSLAISTTRPAAESVVTMIGTGYAQENGLVFWNSSWTQLPSSVGASYYGYNLSDTYLKRWGQNFIVAASGTNPDADILVNAGFGNVYSMYTTFLDFVGDTASAQAVYGDSGGAVFYQNGGNWELAGVMHAISQRAAGQPTLDTVAYGQQTFIADLSVYESQIVAVVVPEPGSIVLAVTGVLAWCVARRSRVASRARGSSRHATREPAIPGLPLVAHSSLND